MDKITKGKSVAREEIQKLIPKPPMSTGGPKTPNGRLKKIVGSSEVIWLNSGALHSDIF